MVRRRRVVVTRSLIYSTRASCPRQRFGSGHCRNFVAPQDVVAPDRSACHMYARRLDFCVLRHSYSTHVVRPRLVSNIFARNSGSSRYTFPASACQPHVPARPPYHAPRPTPPVHYRKHRQLTLFYRPSPLPRNKRAPAARPLSTRIACGRVAWGPRSPRHARRRTSRTFYPLPRTGSGPVALPPHTSTIPLYRAALGDASLACPARPSRRAPPHRPPLIHHIMRTYL